MNGCDCSCHCGGYDGAGTCKQPCDSCDSHSGCSSKTINKPEFVLRWVKTKPENWWDSETKEQLVDRLVLKSETIIQLRLELEKLYKQLVELKQKTS